MGMDLLINALLKAAGYSKEQFDSFAKGAVNEFHIFKQRAIDTETRIANLERGIDTLLQNQESAKCAISQTGAVNPGTSLSNES